MKHPIIFAIFVAAAVVFVIEAARQKSLTAAGFTLLSIAFALEAF